jgi:hypothetical protein
VKLPKHLVDQILSRPGVVVRSAVMHAPTDNTPASDEFVQPSVELSARDKRLTATIPAVTKGNTNGVESKWWKKMSRNLSAKKAVRDTLGPHVLKLVPFAVAWHRGNALRIVFTRLGGRRLDRGNLATSLKAVEDMIEGALLACDGDPRWLSSYEQCPGGPVGVRVEIEIVE